MHYGGQVEEGRLNRPPLVKVLSRPHLGSPADDSECDATLFEKMVFIHPNSPEFDHKLPPRPSRPLFANHPGTV